MDKKTVKLVECKIGRQKDGGTKREGDKKTRAETADRRRALPGRRKDSLTELKSEDERQTK